MKNNTISFNSLNDILLDIAVYKRNVDIRHVISEYNKAHGTEYRVFASYAQNERINLKMLGPLVNNIPGELVNQAFREQQIARLQGQMIIYNQATFRDAIKKLADEHDAAAGTNCQNVAGLIDEIESRDGVVQRSVSLVFAYNNVHHTQYQYNPSLSHAIDCLYNTHSEYIEQVSAQNICNAVQETILYKFSSGGVLWDHEPIKHMLEMAQCHEQFNSATWQN